MRARSILALAVVAATVVAGVAIAHHAAEGIVDEEVYEMISELVADTPHATMDDLPAQPGMTETELTMRTVPSLERMIDDGLLSYISMLDGEVIVTIEFTDRGGVEMNISQLE